MRLPLSWLKEYLTCELSNQELAAVLTLAGLEVDKVEETPFSFCGVIVGEVKTTLPHPNADHLTIAEVYDGEKTLQVLCGDPQCWSGMKTALAPIGATLTDEKGHTQTIKKTKLRGIESFGMLCSEKELGLSDQHTTIMHFPKQTPVGIEVRSIFSDTLFDISLTPNLGHCMSVFGIARDLAALLDKKVTKPSIDMKRLKGEKGTLDVEVNIEEEDNCYRYSSSLIKNVKVGPSPKWLKQRLKGAGMRSVNNIVDITNFVMFEMGHPLHPFDYEKIGGKTLHIKSTKEKTPFETLDGKKQTIPAGTLMVYGEKGPLAIAGIMGGIHSEVTEHTSTVLLESAHFSPSAVRWGSKKLKMRTEASARFERGIDPEGVVFALDRATALICELTGGEVQTKRIDRITHLFKPRVISARLSRTNHILGTKLSLSEVESFLHRLEMQVKSVDEDTIQVTIPSYRNDLHAEIDLIEEVARIYGYNHIPKKQPKVTPSSLPHSPLFLIENKMRNKLVGEGLQEFSTCSLISSKLAKLSLETSLGAKDAIVVLHPSSLDQSILRTSALPGLLQAIKNNFDHQTFNIAAFEIGRVHFKHQGKFQERSTAAIIWTGNHVPNHWGEKGTPVDFFDLKGILENILEGFSLSHATFTPSKLNTFHPGKQAQIHSGALQLGVLGEVHPHHLLKLGIKERVFFSQIDLHDLLEAGDKGCKMSPLPLYPGSDRDWTLTLKKELPSSTLLEAIREVKSTLLKEVHILDIYTSDALGDDCQNITLRFLYREDTHTIEQKQVEKEHRRIVESVTKKIASFLIS